MSNKLIGVVSSEGALKGVIEDDNFSVKVQITESGPRGDTGPKGNDGYTPVKGVDYFDGKDGKDGYTPIKGIDYFDGEKGDVGPKGDKGDKGDTGVVDYTGLATTTYVDSQDLLKADKTYVDNKLSEKADKQQEAWITPTLLNGWTSTTEFKFRKNNFGMVEIEGVLAPGEGIICILPVGYRPSRTVDLVVNSGDGFGSLRITANGNMTRRVGKGTWVLCFGLYYSLD